MSTSPTPARPVSSTDLEAAHPSIGTLVKETTTHFSTLLRSEIELAKSEVGKEAKKAVAGSIFLVVAGVVALLALPFVFVTIAEVLIGPVGLARWLGYLIVVVFFFLVAAVSAFLGIRKFKKVHAPERTVDSLKKDAELTKVFSSSAKPDLS